MYDSIIEILSSIDNRKAINLIKKLATIKPIYSFQTLYNLLVEFAEDKNHIEECLNSLEKYIDYKIDVFMLINVIYF